MCSLDQLEEKDVAEQLLFCYQARGTRQSRAQLVRREKCWIREGFKVWQVKIIERKKRRDEGSDWSRQCSNVWQWNRRKERPKEWEREKRMGERRTLKTRLVLMQNET